MKNKGFTLIELLAVIVLIAIVTLISIPLIRDVIEKAQKGALKASVQGIAEAANYYYQANMKESENNRLLEFNNGKQTDSYEKLSYKGLIEHGMVLITTDNKSAICIDNGKWYAKKELNQKEATIGDGICDGITADGIINVTNKCEEDINACNEEKEELESEIETGKEKIANAIKSRGYEINKNKSFEELATGIKSISSGPMFYVKTVNPTINDVKIVYRKAKETDEYSTNYIQIKKLTSNEYDEFTIAADTAKTWYSPSLGNCECPYRNAFNAKLNSKINVIRFSPTVIGVMYRRIDYTTDTDTTSVTDYYTYLKTFKWDATNNKWVLVTTLNLRPIMYRDTSYTNKDNHSYYSCDRLQELPFQDTNNYYATFATFLSGDADNGTTTYTYYTKVAYLSVNKTTGAVSYAIGSSSSAYSETFNYTTNIPSKTVYNFDADGMYSYTYSDPENRIISKTTYYSYILGANGSWATKTIDVPYGSTDPVTDLTKKGYVSSSRQRYWLDPSISINTSSKTITTTVKYKEIPPDGYDDLSVKDIKQVSKTFNISNALPSGKSVSGSMQNANVPENLKPGYYFLDYTTGQFYAIYKLNSGYLYITGEVVEKSGTSDYFYKQLSLEITGVRYSDTLYDGTSSTSTVRLNEPGNHYLLSTEYMLAIK